MTRAHDRKRVEALIRAVRAQERALHGCPATQRFSDYVRLLKRRARAVREAKAALLARLDLPTGPPAHRPRNWVSTVPK